MKQFLLFAAAMLLCACNNMNTILKSSDYSYKYEVAKQLFAEGKYNQTVQLLGGVVTPLKGTDRGEEALFLYGLSSYMARDYEAASTYLKKYYESYPRGMYVEEAHYYSGMALYKSTPEPRLDQTATYEAVTEFTEFISAYPTSRLRRDAQDRVFELQDKLIEKEYLAAKLYYDLGSYTGNGMNGNYQACITTAQNALKDYPDSKRREDFAILILKAKFDFARNSVAAKQGERYADALEEYFAFKNEYPESAFIPNAQKMVKAVPAAFRTADIQ